MTNVTICKRVETLGRDDHLSAPGFVLVFAVGDLLYAVLRKGIVLEIKG